MFAVSNKTIVKKISAFVLGFTFIVALAPCSPLFAGDKKKAAATEKKDETPAGKKFFDSLDLSKFVWPNPPAVTRIRYLNYWSGEKFVEKKKEQKKQSWMERVAGVTTGETPDNKPRWQLLVPSGVAVDSKGKVYIADSKVRAIFIVDTETGDYEMIKNGSDARFQWMTGLAIDDSDRLFIADSGMKRILIMDSKRKPEGQITKGLQDPGGLAIDNENRILYVTDAEQDLVLAYNADPPYQLIRKIGKEGTKHTSRVPGEFAKPTYCAVDQDGNLYVSDTWNDRIEIFDADGNFIRTFGKAGDGPGYFARPKGIAIDSDGHVWVADAMQDRVQVYTPEGRLLIWMGGHGQLPGMFQSINALAIDKNNRVFTSEQFPGRVQFFRYTTNAEAKAELDRRAAEVKKKQEEHKGSNKAAETQAPAAAPKQ